MTAFWKLDASGQALAVIEPATERTLTYGQLAVEADSAAQTLALPPGKALIFIFCRNDVASLAFYLGGLRAGHAVALFPAGAVAQAPALLAAYAPERVLAPPGAGPFPGYAPVRSPALGLASWQPAVSGRTGDLPDNLALLLSTSGTTGSPKLVRLSHTNLQSNALAIGEYLGLTPAERAPTTLPLSYSYGLSVVHSHLAAGAALILGDFPVVQGETWAALRQHGATSLAGVPFLYQLLRRLRFDPRSQPALRTYTQAGGRLEAETKRWFLAAAAPAAARFFVMYGQTEATARISYVPPEQLPDKLDSIGRAIPGGTLSLDPSTGEIIYRGPNVMLGYAGVRADLAQGDALGGVLRTGDLGRIDADGFFQLEGRLKRFLKLAGLRVGLDELERLLETRLGAAVACSGQDDALVVHAEAAVPSAHLHACLLEEFGLPPSLVTLRSGVPLARLANGKVDYAALAHA